MPTPSAPCDHPRSREDAKAEADLEFVVRAKPLPWFGSILFILVSFLSILSIMVVLRGFWREAFPDLYERVFERGWITETTLALGLIAFSELIVKMFLGRWCEKTPLAQFALDDPGALGAGAIHGLSKELRARFETGFVDLYRNSRWIRRVGIGLLQAIRGDTKANIRGALQQQALSDEAASDQRFLFSRTLLWSLPLLGFLGTVIGIGEGVSGFALALDTSAGPTSRMESTETVPLPEIPTAEDRDAQLDRLQEALKVATEGLSVAFDSTLVALGLVIPLTFLLVFAERCEARRLNRIGDLCEQRISCRIPDCGLDRDESPTDNSDV